MPKINIAKVRVRIGISREAGTTSELTSTVYNGVGREARFNQSSFTLGCSASTNFRGFEMRAKSRALSSFATCGLLLLPGFADAATVVALGASNTAGKGVSPSQAYPAQLESMLRAKGFDAHVINAGVSGDTTGGMMARLDSAVPKGTTVVILQPGGNDLRKGAPDYTAEVRHRLGAMGIRVVMLPNGMFRGKPHQPDGMHLTPEGYHLLAQQLVGPVTSMLRK